MDDKVIGSDGQAGGGRRYTREEEKRAIKRAGQLAEQQLKRFQDEMTEPFRPGSPEYEGLERRAENAARSQLEPAELGALYQSALSQIVRAANAKAPQKTVKAITEYVRTGQIELFDVRGVVSYQVPELDEDGEVLYSSERVVLSHAKVEPVAELFSETRKRQKNEWIKGHDEGTSSVMSVLKEASSGGFNTVGEWFNFKMRKTDH
jgi:hypothetical protein